MLKLINNILLKTGRLVRKATIGSVKKIYRHFHYHPLQFSFHLVFFTGACIFYFAFLKYLPNPYDLRKKPPDASTKIYDRNGSLLYKVFRDENRTLFSLDEIPKHVIQATIATEDKSFYEHQGLSLKGIIRAARHDFLKQNSDSKDIQGGSTITQQLIKNSLLTPERTYTRKFKELFLAPMVELLFTKDEILEMYFNQVSYGGTAYGIEEASQMYFGKSVRQVNLAEATLLASLPPAPTLRCPYNNPKLAKKYQKEVLKRMVNENYITLEELEKTEKEVLAFAPRAIIMKAPHFVEYVKSELISRYGQQVIEKGGLHVYTTLDLKVQEMAEQAVTKNIDEINKKYNARNGAALVTAPASGEILAMVGSVNFWDAENDGNVNVTTSLRQPGSSIKLVNYSYAMEHAGYTPSSILLDTPVSYSNAWETYTPVNYDHRFKGRVTLKTALAESRNVPAVKVLNTYGVDKMIEQGKKMGITTWNEPEKYGLSITLGAAEVKMTDMGVVFGSIANMGTKVPLAPIKKIADSRGKVLFDIDQPPSRWADFVQKIYASDLNEIENGEPVVSPQTAWQIIDILSDNDARAPEFGRRSPLLIPERQVAVKTGTSNDFRDNWTIGFSPDYLVATWVGNNDNDSMFKIASGITGAAPMWHDIITQLTEDKPDSTFPVPEGMIEIEVCATNGLLPCKGCPKLKKAWFVPGTEPKKKCYFPSPSDCQAKKKKMEEEGKSPEEIVKALRGCPLGGPKPSP